MKTTIEHNDQQFQFDLSDPIDISLPLRPDRSSVRAFHAPAVKIEPVQAGDFVGAVSEGGAVNFNNIHINPHGNGTHTECVGHITEEKFTINDCLKRFHWWVEVVTIQPTEIDNGDKVVTLEQIKPALQHLSEAVIIRTEPNTPGKQKRNYSGTNPPYLLPEVTEYLCKKGVCQLLVDLPSVDREDDGGKLLAHKAFWQFPQAIRQYCTITEMVYVPDEVEDGIYLLNLQIISLENDASPSKPVLYRLKD